jgi:membrane-associated protein
MELLTQLLDYMLHLDEYFLLVVQQMGVWSYVILFAVIFAETGLVVMPLLPGDSFLFVAGTLAGGGHLQIIPTYIVLLIAAIVGDTVNYWVGHHIGAKVFEMKNSRIFKKEHLEKTRAFYEKHGGKTIILARFLPIIRTFAPFVAGVGKMDYKLFIQYNMIGGVLWVTVCVFLGYFFGGLPVIQENFELAILGIIFVSLLPLFYEFVKHHHGEYMSRRQLKNATYAKMKATIDEVEDELEK